MLGLWVCTWMIATAALGATFAGELREEDSSEMELEPEVKVGVVAWKK